MRKQKAPALLKKSHFFPGWWVVIGSALISFWGGAGFYSITAFINPIVDYFGWSYLTVSLAASLRSVELGLLAPAIGFLADRWGPRSVALVGGFITTAGFILLSMTDSLLMFYIAFFVYGVGMTGMGHVVTTTAVANWFRKKAGRAIGFSTAGYGVGGAFVPVIVWLIARYSWQAALVVLGVITLAIIVPSALLLRHRPEPYGYYPDGDKPVVAASGPSPAVAASPAGEELITVRRAVATGTFWLLSLVFLVHMGVISAVTLHAMPFFASVGLSRETGAVITMLIPITSVVGRLGIGWLGDIFGQRRVMIITFVLMAAGICLFAFGSQVWHFIISLILFGPAYGGGFTGRTVLQRLYFGRGSFGSIQGLMLGLTQIGGLLGPTLAGWVFDVRGSYELIWLAYAIATLATIPLILAVRKVVSS